ncbi:MAG: aldolase catalytic domain-containing protein [Clostridium sp.]|nr:aldolase catalytic domain-containing protein [Clostridium sp.]
MKDIRLLDCTLRDGGYVNDWEFGRDNIVNIFERLVSAGVDIIEVGFLDERRPYDPNRTIFPDTESVNKTFGRLDKGKAMVVAMIDYGTCGIEHLQPQSETCLDGIRVIFKNFKKEKAIAFCREVKALGYRVFAQAVSITSYSDRELLDLVDLANDLEPETVSIVDTYGLMHEDHVQHYFELLDYNLKPGIQIGYHAHNNFQLAYSNSIELLRVPTRRTMVVDGSLHGMGKSAGNLPIELMSMYLNGNYGRSFDISQLLEAIDMNIMPFYRKTPWGYKMFFYIAASHQCHPNYVSWLMNKQTLSLSQIAEILNRLEGEKKLLYDKEYIERLYMEFQSNECNDEEALRELSAKWRDQKLLILGPGANLLRQKDRVKRYIAEKSPVVITINYLPEEFKTDYIFLTNSRRYNQLNTRLALLGQDKNWTKDFRTVATSNIPKVSGDFDYILNYSSLIDRTAEYMDNSFVMLLHVMAEAGVHHVACAGFDGYSTKAENYFDSEMDYRITKEKFHGLNEYVAKNLKELRGTLAVDFVTDSRYPEYY